jgi:ATP-binding cassette subfamily F protein 3
VRLLEERIARAEEEAARIEAELASPEIWKDPEQAAEMTKKYNLMKAEIDALYEEWSETE